MFSMNFQPDILDSSVQTIWDLAEFNVVLQNGILQSGRMTFNCYSSSQNIGNNEKILSQKAYILTAAQIAAFQAANNLQPKQIAVFAYMLAQFIQDVVVTPVILNEDGTINTPAVMASFFQGATNV